MELNNNLADKLLSERLEMIKKSLLVKGKEYCRNEDRMHNFNVGSRMKDCQRERIIESFKLKHEISVQDMLNDIDNGLLPSIDTVSEKFGDIINYYILMEMSIKHKISIKDAGKKEN